MIHGFYFMCDNANNETEFNIDTWKCATCKEDFECGGSLTNNGAGKTNSPASLIHSEVLCTKKKIFSQDKVLNSN